MTVTLNHLGDKPEPVAGDRTGLAAHMGSVKCPACDWSTVTGSAMTADLAYSLHWREEQAAERDAGDHCRTCGEPYDGYGDGYDGECPDCADRTERERLMLAALAEQNRTVSWLLSMPDICKQLKAFDASAWRNAIAAHVEAVALVAESRS